MRKKNYFLGFDLNSGADQVVLIVTGLGAVVIIGFIAQGIRVLLS